MMWACRLSGEAPQIGEKVSHIPLSELINWTKTLL